MDDQITQHLIEIKTTLAAQDTKLASIEDAVLGSERGPGLTQKVGELERSKNMMYGIGAGLTGAWSIIEWLVHRGHK